jgi:hypothetical protein
MHKRENLFKSASDKLTTSKRYITYALEVRKQKFDDFIGIRRQYTEVDDIHSNTISKCPSDYKNYIKSLSKKDYNLSQLSEYCDMLASKDSKEFTEGIIAIRKLFASLQYPPCLQIIENGTIKLLLNRVDEVDFLLKSDYFWIMTNVASCADNSAAVYLLNNGILKVIENCLENNPLLGTIDQIIWLMANLSADDNSYIIYEESLLNKLISLYSNDKVGISEKINVLWAFSNITRKIDQEDCNPPLWSAKWLNELAHHCINAIYHYKVLNEEKTNSGSRAKALTYVLHILQKLSNVYTKEIFSALMAYNCISKLLNLFSELKKNGLLIHMRLLGSFIAYEDDKNEMTQALVDNNIFATFYEIILNSPSKRIKKEIFWSLSNLISTVQEHCKIFLSIPGFLEELFDEYQLIKSYPVRKEIVWCLLNTTHLLDIDVVYRLYDKGIIELIFTYLKDDDKNLVGVCIEGLDNMLMTLLKNSEEKSRSIYYEIKNHDLIYILEDLVVNETTKKIIYKKAYKLLTEYLDDNTISISGSSLMDDI